MAKLATTSVATDTGTYSLALEIRTDAQTLVIEWKLVRLDEQGQTQTGSVTLDFSNPTLNQFSVHIPPGLTGLALCLAGCIGKSLIEPVIECLAGSHDPTKILECLKSKGIQIGSSALACALECLVNHPV
jgi:hypothetical protein